MWIDSEEEQNPSDQAAGTAGTNETPSVGAGAGTAGTAASSSGTTSNPSTQTPTQTNQPSQSFGTVQDYLKGNQQQGEALGAQFTGDLATNQTNEKNAIDTAAQGAQSDINAGTTNYNAGLVNTAVSNPTAVTNNPDQLQSFLNQWNASYSGPSSFENSTEYAPAEAAAAEATTKGTEESTAGGQQQLLADNYGVYGQGNQGLDQAVLQNSSYNPQIQAQATAFNNIPTYLQTQATGLDTAATNAAANTAAAQTQTRAAFANEPAAFQTQINNETSAAQAPATTQAAQIQADFASGDPTKIAADLKAANPNMDTNTIQQYLAAYSNDFGKPVDLSQFYNYNPATAVTTANAATPQDYANAAAYQQLTGTDYSGILNQANAAQAGTAPTATSGINSANIADYLKQQYTDAELAKLGAPVPTNGGVSNNPNITGPSSIVSPTGNHTDVPGAVVGGAIGSGIGNAVAGPIGGVVGGFIGSTIGGNSGLSNSINNALGIGGGKKDAVVYLPPMNLPPMPAPANADPATTKLLTDIFNKPVSTAGSYHEGAVSDIVSRIGQLQTAQKNGEITPQEFNTYAGPLEQWAQQASQKIMSASSPAANANKPAYNQLQQYIKESMQQPNAATPH